MSQDHDETCMNPTMVCVCCIFNVGRLSKWCLAEERKTKLAREQFVVLSRSAARERCQTHNMEER